MAGFGFNLDHSGTNFSPGFELDHPDFNLDHSELGFQSGPVPIRSRPGVQPEWCAGRQPRGWCRA